MSKKTKNNIIFAVEQTVFGILFIVFTVLNFFEISEKIGNYVYIAVIVLAFGWLFIYEHLFPEFDNAVHFKNKEKYYIKTSYPVEKLITKRKGLKGVLILWAVYLVCLAILRFTGIFDWKRYLMGACFMFMLNSYFVRKKCYLSKAFLHNKNDCCKNCTINNWDYAIFASSLLFAPHLSVEAYAVNIIIMLIAFVKFIQWEYDYHKHPYRFFPETNAALRCSNCLKQCKFKEQVKSKQKQDVR